MPCKRCGYCCEHVVYAYTNDANNMEWIRARGFKVVDVSKTIILVHVYCPCAQYEKINGIGTCKIQDNKPKSCTNYPMSLDFDLLVNAGIDPKKFLGEQCEFVKEVV